MCESAPSFHHRGIILWCNLYNVSDIGGNNYVGEYSGFFLAFSCFRKLCAAEAIMFLLFPNDCPVVPISPPFAPGLCWGTSSLGVTAKCTVSDSDVKLTPAMATDCFGWCQLVFRDYFTDLAHSVDSRVLLNTPTNFVKHV